MSESNKKKSAATKPVKTIRQGAIAASIWKRQAPSGFEYYDFSLSRSWKAQSTGREGYSQSFFANNATELQAVIEETASWIVSQQAEQAEEIQNSPSNGSSAENSDLPHVVS